MLSPMNNYFNCLACLCKLKLKKFNKGNKNEILFVTGFTKAQFKRTKDNNYNTKEG